MCRERDLHKKALATDDFSIDPQTLAASLDSEFAGLPLSVQWTAGEAANETDATAPESVYLGRGADATASVALMGVECEGNGALSYHAGAEADRAVSEGAAEPTKVPKGFRTKKAKVPVCSQISAIVLED